MKSNEETLFYNFFGLSVTLSVAQNVTVQTIEGTSASKADENKYYINGICTCEDIGGVDAPVSNYNAYSDQIDFVNYNEFPVTVIYEIKESDYTHIGTVVLKAGERKEKIGSKYYNKPSVTLITRKIGSKTVMAVPTEKPSYKTLLGYLHVFPDFVGRFEEFPHEILNQINANKSHGRSDWRIPTEHELTILQSHGLAGCTESSPKCYSYYYKDGNGRISWNYGDGDERHI